MNVFAEPTINDFRDSLRWHLTRAMTRARTAIGRIKSEHAAHGALQSNRTYLGIFAAVRREFEAGTNTALGELKRVVRITRLDRTELRQAALQCLNDFAIEAKALIDSNKLRSIDNSIIKENLRSLDEDLSFAVRQFDVRILRTGRARDSPGPQFDKHRRNDWEHYPARQSRCSAGRTTFPYC